MSKRRTAVHDEYAHQILTEIEAGNPISQRSLASSLGIALGMTNLLLRRLVRKGWVRVSHVRPNRVAYFLTPTGMAEKARMSRAYFQHSVRYYASARDRMSAAFADLSRRWPADVLASGAPKDVVFFGTGEVAEIAYVCLQETDLRLVGAIDFQGRERFFGVPVHAAATLTPNDWHGLAGPSALAITFTDSEQVRTCLDRLGLPPESVVLI